MHLSRGDYFALLRRYLTPHWKQVTGLALLLLGATALQLIGPQFIAGFIDQAGADQPVQVLIWLAIGFIAVALLAQLANLGGVYLSELLAWSATNQLRGDLALHCLNLDMPFHKAHPPGVLIERIDGDVAALANFFSQFVLRVIGGGLLLIGALVLLFREDWRLGTALTVFALIALGLMLLLRNFATPLMAAERAASAGLFGLIEEHLAGLEDVRSNGGGAHAVRRLQRAERIRFQRDIRAVAAGFATFVATIVLFGIGYAIALGLGAWLYQRGLVSLGVVYLCFQYTQMLRRPIELLADQLREFQRAGAGLGRIKQLFARHSAINESGRTHLPAGPLAVEIDHLSFHYNDEPDDNDSQDAGGVVLDDIELYLRPGEVLGVLGRTGSGKTTLSRMLLRLYDPTAGAIRLAGSDLRDLAPGELRRHTAIVTQEVQLFRANLRDNLTLFDPSVSDERIWEALAALGLADWARGLPAGLDTPIAGSDGISAGEAQLLAFARVFLRDPGLIILDEASSRLDPDTERRIEQAVDRLLAGRTAIIIAHRLATIQRTDSVLILDNGQIAEYGPRELLSADPQSRFSGLLRVGMEEVIT
ncbi:MAG: ABC transporter ATP-binding protein [Oscillochloris sp.]|nr:ABC transporter ATP-binding protein [Oscillochloris sp.]